MSTTPYSGVFHVTAGEAGTTLAALIKGRVPGLSWSQSRGWVRSRRVLIDGNICQNDGRRLKEGEVVKVLPHSTAPAPRETDVIVRYLDSHIIVVEKPSGMTSVRYEGEKHWSKQRKQRQPTLDESLPKIISKMERRQKGRHRNAFQAIRPVHRIDRDTSGLMIFARSHQPQLHLNKQFRVHSVGRLYLAIVQGQISRAATFDTRLIRDRGDGRRGSTSDPDAGRRAVTHIRPLEQFAHATLVECQLETGRTHQIRIHLAEAGHPLCGEKIYNQTRRGLPDEGKIRAPRLALHAAFLSFNHPADENRMEFQSSLPRDLDEFLRRLEKIH